MVTRQFMLNKLNEDASTTQVFDVLQTTLNILQGYTNKSTIDASLQAAMEEVFKLDWRLARAKEENL